MSIPWPTLTTEQWSELLAHPEKRDALLAEFDAQVLPDNATAWGGEPPTKGGAGSGNHGHAGRPGEVGGSAPNGGGADDNLALLVREVHEHGGFTYDPVAHQAVVHGLALSVDPERMKLLSEDKLSEADLAAFRDANMALLTADRHKFMGAWKSGGQVYLDVVTVFTDHAEAEKFARANRQLAYFDLDQKIEIPLPGSEPTAAELEAASKAAPTGEKPRLFLLGGGGALPTDEEIAAVVAAIRGPESARAAQKAQRALDAVKLALVLPSPSEPVLASAPAPAASAAPSKPRRGVRRWKKG